MADKKISDGALRDITTLEQGDVAEVEKPGTAIQYKTTLLDVAKFVLQNVVAVGEPATPANGTGTFWLSNGTGAGDDGDLMWTVTDSGGTTKTVTVLDFSAIP